MLSRTRTHGRPGRSARRIARSRHLGAGFALVVAVVGGASLLAIGAPLAGLAVVAIGWLMSRRASTGARRAQAGRDAEIEVAHRLRRVRAAAIVYDARFPGRSGDVDVVVLGPMAAAVEVKRGSGRVRCKPDGRVVAGGRELPGAPLRQALAQAVATRRAVGLDARVEAVLCVTEMRQRPRLVGVGDDEVWVTSMRHLPKVLRRLPRSIDRATALDAASQAM